LTYSFLPNKNTAVDLSLKFRTQLKESFIEMLQQLEQFRPDIFKPIVTEYFYNLQVASFTGFHSFLYHLTIKLAEQSKFDEIARIMLEFSRGKYESLPRFASSHSIESDFFRVILDQIRLGTTHQEITLYPIDSEIESAVAKVSDVGVRRLEVAYPELAAENAAMVRSILFFDSAGATDERALSFTGDKLQSLILVNGTIEPTWIFFLDKLVHEAAHTYLYAINLSEELVLNTREPKFSSPLRRDDRDMMGIYHATFVIQRLILAFSKILSYGDLTAEDESEVKNLLRYYFSRVDSGYQTVLEHGKLSSLARRLITEGQDCVQELSASFEASPPFVA
jgi:hypothetical protein